jgi:hypothetical protein
LHEDAHLSRAHEHTHRQGGQNANHNLSAPPCQSMTFTQHTSGDASMLARSPPQLGTSQPPCLRLGNGAPHTAQSGLGLGWDSSRERCCATPFPSPASHSPQLCALMQIS